MFDIAVFISSKGHHGESGDRSQAKGFLSYQLWWRQSSDFLNSLQSARCTAPCLLPHLTSRPFPSSPFPRHTALLASVPWVQPQALSHLPVSHTTPFSQEPHSPHSSHGWLPSSHKSSLNVTSSERLSVAICICQGAGGKQWHTCMRIIQGGLIKGLFIKAWSKTKGDHKGQSRNNPGLEGWMSRTMAAASPGWSCIEKLGEELLQPHPPSLSLARDAIG